MSRMSEHGSGSATSSNYDSDLDSNASSSTSSSSQYASPRHQTHSTSNGDCARPTCGGGDDRQGGASELRNAEKGPAPRHPFSLKGVTSGGLPIPILALGATSFRSANGAAHEAMSRNTISSTDMGQAATPRGSLQGSQHAVSSGSGALIVELLSSAFSLNVAALMEAAAQGLEPAAAVLRRTAAGLGVHSSALKLFELRELAPGAPLPKGTARLAVAVPGSHFSLSEMEEILTENRRLSSVASHSVAALEAMQKMANGQSEALAAAQLEFQESEAAACRLQLRSNELERDAASLREQLQRSKELSQQGQKSLGELKYEFEELTRDFADGNGLSLMQPDCQHPDSSPADQGLPMTHAAANVRVIALLERLSDEATLSRLEQWLDKLSES